MICKKCGNEIKDGTQFCTKCGEPVLSNNTVHKKSKKKIIIPIAAVCAVLTVAIIITAVVSDSGSNDSYTESDYQYNTEYETYTSEPELLTENVTKSETLYNPIGKETLQYPAQNDILTYDVYETYVEITGSVNDDLTGELVIPETLDNLPVRSISNRAFGGPGEAFTTPGYSISSLVLPDNLYQISDNAFYKCKNLNSITFGSNIITIGSMAFAYASITSLTIPDSVTDMGSAVFLKCENLKNVVLGKSMTSVPDSIFQACSSLSDIQWNENISIIEEQAFSGTAFEKIDLPNTVTELGNHSFSFMNNLKEFVFPDSVNSIGSWVLSDCPNLNKVTIGSGITSLPEYLFSASPSITELIIPANVLSIHSNIFGEGTFASYSKPIVYGEKGSEAARFASSKGLAFKLIEN